MSDLNCLRVLYVEDDEATREAFSKFLKRRTGRLLSASSGEEGLQKYHECKPNLLIVDLIMPGMSGLEMIGEIRKTDKACHVMITSSVNDVKTVLEAVDLGIDHYIVNPIDTEDLERKLEGIGRGIESREEKFHNPEFTNLEKRGIIEDSIRREFLKIMKIHLGKGPQDVRVLLFENQVEITAMDAVTVMEKTIASNHRNISVVEQFRKLFYEELSPKLEECVEQASGYLAKVTSLNVDGAKRIDKIVLTFV